LVINLLKILCTNTAWQRRKLGKSLQDWSTVSIQVCEIMLFSYFFLLSSARISRFSGIFNALMLAQRP